MGEMADAIRESTVTIVALHAENARLKERGDGYKSESEASFARARRAEVQSERRRKALAGMGDNPDCLQCRDNKERARAAAEEEG